MSKEQKPLPAYRPIAFLINSLNELKHEFTVATRYEIEHRCLSRSWHQYVDVTNTYQERWEQLANGTWLSIRHGSYDGKKQQQKATVINFLFSKRIYMQLCVRVTYHLVRVWDCRVQYRRDHYSPATSTMESMTGWESHHRDETTKNDFNKATTTSRE